MNQNMMAKILNASVTGRHFVNEDINNFIYASLSQPPIKIIDKCGSDDEMDYIVECPNCGKHVKYGDETFMLSGHIYCKNEGCRDSLVNKDPYLRELYGKVDKKDES